MFAIPGSRKGYYQWDLNQRLYIQDNSCNEVHFCSEKHPESLTCWVQEEGGKRYVQVPNILLQSCLPITVFAYVKGADEAYTKRSLCIEVSERPKPDDYVYTETEVKTWESAALFALREAKKTGFFKGDKGEKGDKGDTGEQGPRGEKGDKGDGVLTEEEKLEFLICCREEGARINLEDAGERPLVGLRIFGKTTHSGTPTPDAPVKLMNVGESGSVVVTVGGEGQAQTVAASTPDGLPGIPVSSGGNYTDEAGRQWICDEVDFARGVYVRRINVVDFSNAVGLRREFPSDSGQYRFDFTFANNPEFLPNSTLNSILCNALTPSVAPVQKNDVNDAVAVYTMGGVFVRCDRFASVEAFLEWARNVDLTVAYPLTEPVEIPLDEETLAAYATLHTYKPNTMIFSDAGAWLQVSYAADTKAYIDNKFAELAAAIVNNT